MIGRQQHSAIGRLVTRAVFEDVRFFASQQTEPLQVVEIRLKSNPAQRHNDSQILQCGNFAVKKRRTVGKFARRRLIVRRRATGSSGDVEIIELHPIVAIGSVGLAGESSLIQDGEHEVAGSISGERPSGAVGAMRARRQAQDQNPGLGIAESRHRLAPVFPVEIGAAFFAGDLLPVLDQTRTESAGDNFAFKDVERVPHVDSVQELEAKLQPAFYDDAFPYPNNPSFAQPFTALPFDGLPCTP